MRDYIKPAIDQITSTRWYIIYSLSAKIGRTPWIVEYIVFIWILYIFAIYLLHKIYSFFVSSTLRQKANYFLACDNVLYEFQYQNINSSQNLDRIKEIIKQWSYEKSYTLFLEKAKLIDWEKSEKLLDQLKKTHSMYANSSRRKTLCWVFLLVVTLGIYKLFLEY